MQPTSTPKRKHRVSLVCQQTLSVGHGRLIVGLVKIVKADPREAHFIRGPLAAAGPVLRIRVMDVAIAVVVPGRDVDHRTRREDRRHVLSVVIGDAPAELVLLQHLRDVFVDERNCNSHGDFVFVAAGVTPARADARG